MGDWGTVNLQNLRWRTAHASVPQYLRTTVIRCEAKYELTKIGFAGGHLGCEIGVFDEEKGSPVYVA